MAFPHQMLAHPWLGLLLICFSPCSLFVFCFIQITIGYSLSTINKTIWYNQPVTVLPASANITSPVAIYADAPSVTVTLPVYTAPSSAFATQVPKAVVGLAVVVASMMML